MKPLHTETVDKSTLELLANLQQEELLQDFCLVGGTALALYIGHRKSVDLDLFSTSPFDVDRLAVQLEQSYGLETSFTNEGTLLGYIDGVKVDFIHYPYEAIRPTYAEYGLRLASMPDIAAMKLSAIAKSGKRIKDFIDVSYLSCYFSLEEMLDFYTERFPRSNCVIPLKALTYFDDIDFDVDLVMLQKPYSWNLVAKRLEEMFDFPQKVFHISPLQMQPDRKIENTQKQNKREKNSSRVKPGRKRKV